jgi:hypothetical protein
MDSGYNHYDSGNSVRTGPEVLADQRPVFNRGAQPLAQYRADLVQFVAIPPSAPWAALRAAMKAKVTGSLDGETVQVESVVLE